MKVNIDIQKDNIKVHIGENFLRNMDYDLFLSLLDKYQVEAFEDGETEFSVNEKDITANYQTQLDMNRGI